MVLERKLSNYHTHSKYCDGHGELEEYIYSSLEKGIRYLGFSSHAPLPFKNNWTISKKDFFKYRELILMLKEKYKEILDIFLGLEVDYIPGIISPVSPEIKAMDLDYTIGSVHFLVQLDNEEHWTVDGPLYEFERGIEVTFNGDITEAVKQYYERLNTMVKAYPPDIIGHFDIIKKNNKNNRFFSESEHWYKKLVYESLDAVAKSHCILEVNTGGIVRNKSSSLYPSEWILKRCLKLDIPITISSDAHNPEQIDGYFRETFALLKSIGFSKYFQLKKTGWIEADLKNFC